MKNDFVVVEAKSNADCGNECSFLKVTNVTRLYCHHHVQFMRVIRLEV